LSDDGEESLYDESDVRVRPNRKGTRPRTKNRPAHEAAVDGMVIAVDRGRYTVLVDPDGPGRHAVTATRARELGKDALVTGDRVALVGDTTGDEGSLARIVRIHDRSSILRRSADDTVYLPLVSRTTFGTALLDAKTAQPLALLALDSF
jgi:ribosome biogenesis GTPase